MKVLKEIKKLCQPAYLYLVISIFGIVIAMIQNLGNTNKLCLGNFECAVPNTLHIFVGKTIYVLFWTFILNIICKSGYKKVSWFIVLVPFMVSAILFGMLILNGGLINRSVIMSAKLSDDDTSYGINDYNQTYV
jgi:hypothetical protein|tara:strand:- start:61 stop:462 length:402 start_codon:yes stop_codon:yes gene_type:complete